MRGGGGGGEGGKKEFPSNVETSSIASQAKHFFPAFFVFLSVPLLRLLLSCLVSKQKPPPLRHATPAAALQRAKGNFSLLGVAFQGIHLMVPSNSVCAVCCAVGRDSMLVFTPGLRSLCCRPLCLPPASGMGIITSKQIRGLTIPIRPSPPTLPTDRHGHTQAGQEISRSSARQVSRGMFSSISFCLPPPTLACLAHALPPSPPPSYHPPPLLSPR